MKYLILGAGPSGLSTAYFLKNTAEEIIIVDKNNFVGGLCSSDTINNQIYDYGPHIYHSDNDFLINFWKSNFKDLLLEKDFYSKNYKDGFLYDYPISYESIESFPIEIKKKVTSELNNLKNRNEIKATNFKDYVIELVGPTLQNIFFEKYTEKLWGIPTEKLSANWAPKRIKITEKTQSFHKGQYTACGKFGSGKIMERLSKMFLNNSNNNKILLNKEIDNFEIKNNTIKRIYFKDKDSIDTDGYTIISTIPINILSKFIGYNSKLKFNSVLLVIIVVNKDYVFPEKINSIYYAHENFYFHRVTEQKRYSEYCCSEDKTILCFEVSYTNRKFLIEMSSNDLISGIFEQFCSTNYVKKEDFVKGKVVNLGPINPINEIDYEIELNITNTHIEKINNLHTVGGSAQFVYGDVQTMFLKGKDFAEMISNKYFKQNNNFKNEYISFNQEINILGKKINNYSKPFVIAEIGLNHNGNVKSAEKLIDKALECRCDAVKLQVYKSTNRVSKKVFSSNYADTALGYEETPEEMFYKYELTQTEINHLFNYARNKNIPIFASAFDNYSVDLLIKLNIDVFKIASPDIVNLPLIKYIASKGKPIIISSGMASLSDIENALDTIKSVGNQNVILLHCVSEYPADINICNLKCINTLKNTFNILTGYSDHTVGTLACDVAMTLGARVIEKHFTLNKQMEGPDHILSSDVEEMKHIIRNRDSIYNSLGDGVKRILPTEYKNINFQRKGIYSKSFIKSGEKLTDENICIKGPGQGILPKYINTILEKKVNKDIESDHPITWNELLNN